MPTIVDYATPADPRTGNRTPLAITQPNPTKERIVELSLDDMQKALIAMQSTLADLIQRQAQPPFGGPVTYLKNVPFVSGVSQTLAHFFDVPASTGAQGTGLQRPPETMRMRVLVLHHTDFANVKVVSSDDRMITLVSDSDVTVDIVLWSVP